MEGCILNAKLYMGEKIRYSKKGTDYHLAVLSILVLVTQQSIAQSSPHRIGIQLGYQSYATAEPILSPLHYSDNYWLWQPSYTYSGEQHYHRFQLSRIESELSSSITSSTELGRQTYVDLLGWQMQYLFLRKIRNYNQWILWAGGTLEATYFDKEIFAAFDFIDGRAADVFIALSPTVAGTTPLGKNHQLRGQLSITPFAYVAGRTYASNRPPLEMIGQDLTVGNALRYGDWLTFINFVNLRGEMMYGYSLGKHWELQLTYNFQYYHYDKLGPFDVRTAINTLLTGVSFSL